MRFIKSTNEFVPDLTVTPESLQRLRDLASELRLIASENPEANDEPDEMLTQDAKDVDVLILQLEHQVPDNEIFDFIASLDTEPRGDIYVAINGAHG